MQDAKVFEKTGKACFFKNLWAAASLPPYQFAFC
jgi:hypothetical protein